MNCFRRHWYEVGAVVALALLRQESSVRQQLLLVNFIVLLVPRYEEYGWPGDEPATMNMVLKPRTTPNCCPLNQNSAMIINILAVYGFYLVPVFFPTVIWLALAPVPFGIVQFVVHGIVTNVKLRSIYNPGLAGRT